MQIPPGRSEAELVADCRAGKREAFDELVSRHYDRILRLAYGLAGPEAAPDLAQETFLAAVRSFAHFRGESQLATWLVAILRNQVSLYLRGQRRKMAPLQSEGERLAAPPERPAAEGVREILDRVRELPEELRTALVLFYVDGLKYAEIAQAMECPIGTVRSRLFEARDRLKRLLEKKEAGS